MRELIAPESYKEALPEVIAKIVNGCGPGGWKYDLVPDTLLGLCVTEACNIHDWMYNEGTTSYQKEVADFTLFKNLLTLIDNAAEKSFISKILKYHRSLRAFEYYMAVHEFGDTWFYANKTHKGV